MIQLEIPRNASDLRSLFGGLGRLVRPGDDAATVHVGVGDALWTIAMTWRGPAPITAEVHVSCSMANEHTQADGSLPHTYRFVTVRDVLVAHGCLSSGDVAGAVATLAPYADLEAAPSEVEDPPTRQHARTRQIARAMGGASTFPAVMALAVKQHRDSKTIVDGARELVPLHNPELWLLGGSTPDEVAQAFVVRPSPDAAPRRELEQVLALLARWQFGEQLKADRVQAPLLLTSYETSVRFALPEFDPARPPTMDERIAELEDGLGTQADMARLLAAVALPTWSFDEIKMLLVEILREVVRFSARKRAGLDELVSCAEDVIASLDAPDELENALWQLPEMTSGNSLRDVFRASSPHTETWSGLRVFEVLLRAAAARERHDVIETVKRRLERLTD